MQCNYNIAEYVSYNMGNRDINYNMGKRDLPDICNAASFSLRNPTGFLTYTYIPLV